MARQRNHRPETLGGLENHQVDVLITCLTCNRYVTIRRDQMITRLGRDYPVPEVARHTRCKRCGSRGDESRPDWRVECVPDVSHLLPKIVQGPLVARAIFPLLRARRCSCCCQWHRPAFCRCRNTIERLHEEFKRHIKTQCLLPCAEIARMRFRVFLASVQITLRKVDSRQPFTASQPGRSLIRPHGPVIYRMEIIATGNFHQLSGMTDAPVPVSLP